MALSLECHTLQGASWFSERKEKKNPIKASWSMVYTGLCGRPASYLAESNGVANGRHCSISPWNYLKIYSEIQKAMMTVISKYYEIPKDADPIDYALIASMQAYAVVCGEQRAQERILELKEKLSEYAESPH
jgi:hypothetical protein